jgi:hypothetical protein
MYLWVLTVLLNLRLVDTFSQLVGNADFSRTFDKVTFGFGTEIRRNNLKLERVKKSLMWEVVYNPWITT